MRKLLLFVFLVCALAFSPTPAPACGFYGFSAVAVPVVPVVPSFSLAVPAVASTAVVPAAVPAVAYAVVAPAVVPAVAAAYPSAFAVTPFVSHAVVVRHRFFSPAVVVRGAGVRVAGGRAVVRVRAPGVRVNVRAGRRR